MFMLVFVIGSGSSTAQMSQEPTFQLKEAKTPAESVDSIRLLERALELTETALGPEDRAVAELAYRLAQRYDEAGDYDRALRFYRRALAIKEKVLGPDDPGVGDCLNDMGTVQQTLRDYDEALRLFRRSLVIAEKRYGPEHPEVATTLSNIADTESERSNFAEALRVGQRALQMREKTLGAEHPDIADSLCCLADAHRALGDTTQALALAQRALAIAEKALGPDDALVAECLVSLAEVQRDLQNFTQAVALQKRAVAINERISGPEHPDVLENLRSLAQLWAVSGDRRQGISTLVDLSGRQRRYLARHFQTSSWVVASRVADAFRASSEMLQTLCSAESETASRNAAAEAAEDSALGKAFWEEVQTAHAAFEINQQRPAAALQSLCQSLQSRLSRLPAEEIDQTKRDAKRAELETKLSQAVAELAERVGLVAQGILEQDITLSAVAHQLPGDCVLVDAVQYRRFDVAAKTNEWKEQRYVVHLTFPLANDSTNVIVERVDLGATAPIDQAVEFVCGRMSGGRGYAAEDLLAALKKLSDLVYAPLAKYLTNASHLIICPDGQLGRIPFEMLSHEGRFLIEEKTISYVGSGREIVRLAAGRKSNGQTSRPLVMGNPDFDLDLAKVGQPSAVARKSEIENLESKTESGLALSQRLSRDYRKTKFTPLPGAEAEARSVARLLGEDTVLKVGSEAREAELKAVVAPRVLHLATHGFLLSDQDFKRTNAVGPSLLLSGRLAGMRSWPDEDRENPLARCGIALAGANHAGQITNALAEDGLLTGLDASLLNLKGTELVILSVCDSGSGEVRTGEGVMSLRRAFRIAGAETVLASHWKVNDAATCQLMTDFIRRWHSGEPRAKAWREAQLSLLHSQEFANPYFWAAFTLTGDWR
jgi:CHAT domain-containing protein/Tfp pilus assembly protein PilF